MMGKDRCRCGGHVKVAPVEKSTSQKVTFQKHCRQCGARAKYQADNQQEAA